eukprot:gene12660-3712_t
MCVDGYCGIGGKCERETGECVCLNSFIIDVLSELCIECDRGWYGQGCVRQCKCDPGETPMFGTRYMSQIDWYLLLLPELRARILGRHKLRSMCKFLSEPDVYNT